MIWVAAVGAVALVGVLLVLIVREWRRASDGQGALLLMQREIQQLRADVREGLEAAHRTLGDRLDHAATAVNRVGEQLGHLEAHQQRLVEVGKNLASLDEILRAPKLRGGMGELFLAELLQQILPASTFRLQHRFRSGERVDAALQIGPHLVPVDAKFPLENFRRLCAAQNAADESGARRQFVQDVKRHIESIAQKYIVPDEGTYDFALMYIPAENVYYETIIKPDSPGGESIQDYALARHVIPVSPNTFYAYLQVIIRGLKGLAVEHNAQQILVTLGGLRTDFSRVMGEFGKLGQHLGHARLSFEQTQKRLDRFGEKLTHLGGPAESPPPVADGDPSPEALPTQSVPVP